MHDMRKPIDFPEVITAIKAGNLRWIKNRQFYPMTLHSIAPDDASLVAHREFETGPERIDLSRVSFHRDRDNLLIASGMRREPPPLAVHIEDLLSAVAAYRTAIDFAQTSARNGAAFVAFSMINEAKRDLRAWLDEHLPGIDFSNR